MRTFKTSIATAVALAGIGLAGPSWADKTDVLLAEGSNVGGGTVQTPRAATSTSTAGPQAVDNSTAAPANLNANPNNVPGQKTPSRAKSAHKSKPAVAGASSAASAR